MNNRFREGKNVFISREDDPPVLRLPISRAVLKMEDLIPAGQETADTVVKLEAVLNRAKPRRLSNLS